MSEKELLYAVLWAQVCRYFFIHEINIEFILTNHSSPYSDQSQLSLFRPITMCNKQQTAMMQQLKCHFRCGCRHGNMHHSSLYYAINKHLLPTCTIAPCQKIYTLSKLLFLEIFKFPKFWALHFGAPGAISPFFNSFCGMGLSYNFSIFLFRLPFLFPSSRWCERLNYGSKVHGGLYPACYYLH